MSALGIGMTTQERETGWEAITPTTHPQTQMMALALSCWQAAARLADEANPDWVKIHKLQELAKQMEELDKCDVHENEQYAKAAMLEEGLP